MKILAIWFMMNALTFADYRQTIYIAKHPAYHEVNPILGEHPSVGKVNAYFAASFAAKNIVFWTLPDKYKAPFGLGMSAISAGLIIHNNCVGIKIDF